MRKKLFAILMSAMMMVTFMPAMAFAYDAPASASDTVFADDFSTVTVSVTDKVQGVAKTETVTIDTERIFHEGGWISARVDQTKAAAWFKAHKIYDFEDELNKKLNAAAEDYYDLTGAYISNASKEKLPEEITFDQLDNFKASNYQFITLVQPSYTKDYNAKAVNSYARGTADGFDGWTFENKFSQYKVGDIAEQTITVTTNWSTAAPNSKKLLNKELSATMKVLARNAKAFEAVFTLDGERFLAPNHTTKTVNTYYDGATHTIAMEPMTGLSVAYSQFNSKTGKYEPVDAITYKDATTTPLKFAAVVTDAYKYTETYTFTVGVEKAVVYPDLVDGYVFEGDADNLWDYVAIKGLEVKSGNHKKTKTAAYAAAAKADAEAIKTVLKQFYDVIATKQNAALTKLNDLDIAEQYALAIKVVKSTMTPDEQDAFNKATANWTILTRDFAKDTAVKYVVEGKANEVEFLGNATAAKTVHVKSAKAVKKAATRHITAEAKSGTAITFKKMSGSKYITVAADGTMTIKKGLKKGTYKVVVKATAAAGNGYAAASAKNTYTVKVVK